MKYIIVFLFVVFYSLSNVYATNVSGNITANTTWNLLGSPYIVTDDVFVNEGVTLTIDPGVLVKFDSLKVLVVNGTIRAIGDASNLIYFESNVVSPLGSSWGGIYLSSTSVSFNASDLSGCYFKYCYFSYAGTFNKYAGIDGDYLVVKSANSLGFDYCTVYKSNCGLGGTSGSVVSNCIFKDNTADANSGVMVKVTQNSIIHNNLFYDNAISSSSGILSANKNIKIYNNIFAKNSFVFTYAISFSDSCQFYKNTFVDNFVSISANYFKLNKASLFQNTFYRNAIESELFLNTGTSISFHNNSIFNNRNNNSGIEMEMVSAAGIGVTSVAENNYWGSTDSAAVAGVIKDSANDGTLCTIDFVPFNSLPDTAAPVIPPTGVLKEDLLNGKIKVLWNKNIDADLKGYKIYYGSSTGYSFANVFDAGIDTSAEITWSDVNEEIAVTAYDNLATGNKDQYNGNESWFTSADLFVGIHDFTDQQNEINVFPNPGNGNFSIQLSSLLQQSHSKFIFMTMQGTKLFEINSFNKPKIEAYINQPGAYLLKVISDNKIIGYKKIIVLK